MLTDENKGAFEPVDKEAIQKLITELEGKLDALYKRSDELNKGIVESKDALEKVREKRVKLLKERLDKILQQWNIGALTSNHHPPGQNQNQSQSQGQGSTQNQTGNGVPGQFGLPW
ncbi:hypothetical protein F53441_5894 [Fusarium austroafricanum]|uniref:Uncharacterized protein n=1 Tax=Fusarium austroafricanum TaxID=2364996 RepID=A0A8H4KH20_9HYPO|nr:hypothetical protein F53441_5894 [Fusarium austroafricanum]